MQCEDYEDNLINGELFVIEIKFVLLDENVEKLFNMENYEAALDINGLETMYQRRASNGGIYLIKHHRTCTL